MYFLAIFLALFHVSAGILSLDANLGLLGKGSSKKSEALPRCRPIDGPIFSRNPAVAIFIRVFIGEVINSKLLLSLFDLSSSTPEEYSDFLYKYNLDLYTRQGYKEADAIAEFSTRAIRQYFDVLSVALVVRVKASTVANFLFVEGLLTTRTAERLALKYADIIKKSAKTKMTADDTSKFQIIADTFFEFILSVDINARITSPIATYYYGNAWFFYAVHRELIGIL
ncbi:hypothetical protein HNY73_014254 [Argiope bruennichi]|uniref:Uncharacterized protein n=2 Tax=Argiope bruennichi TaxID=94029 RepID=A0A8T0ESH1_ARGBR|nr:hypothetical protein HNY73_014254 [Argiope bruennichi]